MDIPHFDEVLHTYPPQTSPSLPDLNRPLLFIPLELRVSRYNRRILSELCSIFKVDRYLKLAAIFDSTCVFYDKYTYPTPFQTRLEWGRGIISQREVGRGSNWKS